MRKRDRSQTARGQVDTQGTELRKDNFLNSDGRVSFQPVVDEQIGAFVIAFRPLDQRAKSFARFRVFILDFSVGRERLDRFFIRAATAE